LSVVCCSRLKQKHTQWTDVCAERDRLNVELKALIDSTTTAREQLSKVTGMGLDCSIFVYLRILVLIVLL
jgi:hypothetical protein